MQRQVLKVMSPFIQEQQSLEIQPLNLVPLLAHVQRWNPAQSLKALVLSNLIAMKQ